MSELKPRITENGIDYILVGDYYLSLIHIWHHHPLPAGEVLRRDAALVRDFCRQQFVSKGMCVDFAIHDKGDGNPHAHVMLTTVSYTHLRFLVQN